MTACDTLSSGTDPTATPNKELTDLQKSVAQLNDTVGKLGQQAAPSATSPSAAPTVTPAPSTTQNNSSAGKASTSGGSTFQSVLGDTKSIGTIINSFKQGAWTVNATDRLAQNPIVESWIKRLRDPAPSLWKTYPNIPNPDVPDFRVINGKQVPDGVEYGEDEAPYCENNPCDFVVPAWHYVLFSGDYSFLGYKCQGNADEGKGCLLVDINVMDRSVTFRDQYFDNGFRVMGRYWNGDALEWGVWGLVSHASANMLGMETFAHPDEILNAAGGTNAGANCGTPKACGRIEVLVTIHAGDALIAALQTTVSR